MAQEGKEPGAQQVQVTRPSRSWVQAVRRAGLGRGWPCPSAWSRRLGAVLAEGQSERGHGLHSMGVAGV